MAHQLGDLNDIHTGIGKARPKGVAQIVEGKIVNSCLAASGLKAIVSEFLLLICLQHLA